MTRLMYDAINAANLPTGGDLYAGYDDGNWPDAEAEQKRFPHATVLRITTSPATNDGVIGDGPPDNGTWPQWVSWVVKRRKAGVDPTINTNQSNWEDGIAAFKAAGVAQPHWWIAHYDGDPTIPAGAIAKQYATGIYDTSSVAAYWPGVDPAPVSAKPTTPAPKPTQEDDVTTYFPIQVGPDPTGAPNACGVATWPAGAAHVIQLLADPGAWQDTSGEFRLVFNLTSGPDVTTTQIAKPGENTEIQFSAVPGLNKAECRGVTITRPDGKKWPWGGGAE